eukprot:scaffold184977_cov46-Prasinocladus_malaysianus.AAC.3
MFAPGLTQVSCMGWWVQAGEMMTNPAHIPMPALAAGLGFTAVAARVYKLRVPVPAVVPSTSVLCTAGTRSRFQTNSTDSATGAVGYRTHT